MSFPNGDFPLFEHEWQWRSSDPKAYDSIELATNQARAYRKPSRRYINAIARPLASNNNLFDANNSFSKTWDDYHNPANGVLSIPLLGRIYRQQQPDLYPPSLPLDLNIPSKISTYRWHFQIEPLSVHPFSPYDWDTKSLVEETKSEITQLAASTSNAFVCVPTDTVLINSGVDKRYKIESDRLFLFDGQNNPNIVHPPIFDCADNHIQFNDIDRMLRHSALVCAQVVPMVYAMLRSLFLIS
ncbi:hypothetical protein CC1G_15061 [Coprinopsis cinerea okayama7|uniref:Uncharacterized protein n=1 Tax=Coprinopsis cinerea (strain Okayama-7 / 130 / ATCC MYA-4618 / FGSC 9003) TaxID=240176 RepID=D6RP75_COPC7|nr:hypothetical protein CC1G_15061 [Coprinopsis cinerea okayama7\|eukprot:XP_002910727.1 hypothetical protein CC1G_15061 [Coprinopsis cinerea okayama7\